jgi:alkanesulfonate monooxygenase SsuD/methylene tetrahydromethanopterin reductase-like flavin-dependent oxidoreductase (luciferase family)
MRVGIVILPEHPWSIAAGLWRRAEELGFDHAWTYDHIVWGGLQDSPWYGTTPTLAAAATVTERIGLGTFVSSPNYRHPVPFMRDILALDDISGGRFLLGVGSGGNLDSTICGQEPLSPRDKVDRLEEFLGLLDGLLLQDHVTATGRWFSAADVRTLPGCVQRPRVPFLVAANGPRAMAVAARHGQGWVTTGAGGETPQEWWEGVAALVRRLDEVLERHGRRRGDGFDTYLSLDAGPRFSLDSVAAFEDAVGLAADLGFSDVVTHWPCHAETDASATT